MYLKEDNHAYFRQLSSVYRDPRPSFDGSCSSPRLTFSISSLTPCSPLTRYILLSSCSNSFNSDGRTVSRKLNSGKVERACSTEEENLAGCAVARVTHVVSLVLQISSLPLGLQEEITPSLLNVLGQLDRQLYVGRQRKSLLGCSSSSPLRESIISQ